MPHPTNDVRSGHDDAFPAMGLDARNAAELGEAVRRLRKDRGWTQGELARVTSLSRPSVIRLERGEPVHLETLLAALAFLGAKLSVSKR